MIATGTGRANLQMNAVSYTLAAAIILSTAPAFAKDPDCGGPNHWPAAMVFVAMKNAKIVTNDQIDFSRTRVTRIASEQIGPDLWRQVHLVQYFRRDGSALEAIAVSDSSQDECSMGDVKTFVISTKLLPSGEKSN
jgi:hypothetical protein